METDDAYPEFIKKLTEYIDIMAPEKISTFPHQNIVRKGLLISSKVLGKLYRKKGNKPPDHEANIKYKKYCNRNLFNSIKKKAIEAHYRNLLTQAYYKDLADLAPTDR